jgi:hypothetical protein
MGRKQPQKEHSAKKRHTKVTETEEPKALAASIIAIVATCFWRVIEPIHVFPKEHNPVSLLVAHGFLLWF